MGRIRCRGSPVALARMKTTTERMARATSDWRTRDRTKRITARASPRRYFPEASWSKKRSYMTEPGFHLPSVLEVA